MWQGCYITHTMQCCAGLISHACFFQTDAGEGGGSSAPKLGIGSTQAHAGGGGGPGGEPQVGQWGRERVEEATCGSGKGRGQQGQRSWVQWGQGGQRGKS